MAKGRILSGMRPTGELHLGHLVGALSNWKALQDEYECFYMVADWHALMSEYADTSRIASITRDNVMDWLACGIDPKKATIFVQSRVPEHAELHLILSSITPLGWLERCPTYKEQLSELKNRDLSNYAFLGYPVLQAADILLYKATLVPVGEDQLPHLEITREVARRFNSFYGEVFPEPQAKLTESPKLLGLDRRKMSKSYGNTISLSDAPEVIESNVLRMVTDPLRIKRTDRGRPDYCNVHRYYEAFAPEIAPEVARECREARVGCVDCKKRLAKILIEYLADFRSRKARLKTQPELVEEIIEEGTRAAKKVAAHTMAEVRRAIRF